MRYQTQQGINTLVGVIIAIVFILVAVSISNSIFNEQTTVQSGSNDLVYTNSPGNQTFTLSPTGDGVTGTPTATNTSGANPTTVESTSTDGTIIISSPANGTSTVSYNYNPSGFIENGTTRTVLSFITLFIGLAALAMAAMLIMR